MPRRTTSSDTAARYLDLSTKRAARAVSLRRTFWREYRSWIGAKERCYNENEKNYALYGGRGIRVCERWRDSFENFLSDMGTRPAGTSLDRFPDKNGNYEPGNCRWATQTDQSRNSRRARITGEQAAAIRSALAAGEDVDVLARKYQVSRWIVGAIGRGRTWKGV